MAEAGAGLLISGPTVNALTYARRDLSLLRIDQRENWPQGDYIVTCREMKVPGSLVPQFEVIATFERAGAVFGELLRRRTDDIPAP